MLTMFFPAGTLVSVPTPENVLAAAQEPIPSIADMRNLTVFEVRSVADYIKFLLSLCHCFILFATCLKRQESWLLYKY